MRVYKGNDTLESILPPLLLIIIGNIQKIFIRTHERKRVCVNVSHKPEKSVFPSIKRYEPLKLTDRRIDWKLLRKLKKIIVTITQLLYCALIIYNIICVPCSIICCWNSCLLRQKRQIIRNSPWNHFSWLYQKLYTKYRNIPWSLM